MSKRKTTRPYIGLYGNVAILKGDCPDCCYTAFILDGSYACCGKAVMNMLPPTHIKRITEPEQRKRGLSKKTKEQILNEQGYYCMYCERRFGSMCMYKGNLEYLNVVFDHIIPFAFAQNSEADNFVASCQFCNSWKSNLMFDSLESIKIYVYQKIESTSS